MPKNRGYVVHPDIIRKESSVIPDNTPLAGFRQGFDRKEPPSLVRKTLRCGPAGGLGLEYAEYRWPAPAHESSRGSLVQKRFLDPVDHRVRCRGYGLKIIMEPRGDIPESKPWDFITVNFFCQPQI